MKNFTFYALLALVTGLFTVQPVNAQWVDFQAASNVLGQPNFTSDTAGNGLNQMNFAVKAVVDPVTGKIFVSELFGNRVLRFASIAAFTNGATAEMFFGTGTSGTSQTQFNFPQGIIIDSSGRLWVADRNNNRVLRFDNAAVIVTNSPAANGVLGQPNFTTNTPSITQTGMSSPNDVSVDAAGRLWVSEYNNNRVLRFDNAAAKPNGGAADGVLGQPNFTTGTSEVSQTGMNFPSGVYADTFNRLWVSEGSNNRVLRFDNAAAKPNGGAADGVLGQPNFTTGASEVSQTGMNFPLGVFLDLFNRLYVADSSNNRILIFNDAPTLPNGSPASNVLGQPNFTTSTPNNGGISASSMSSPTYPFFHESTRSLYIGDNNNNRVLRFSVAGTSAAGVSVEGRILSGKSGISRATVSVTDAEGSIRSVRTNTFGYYRIEGLRAGETYIFNISAKGYAFAPQVITLSDDLTEVNFEAIE